MYKDINIKFGMRIKELRLANNLTQEQLAEMINIERSNLAKIEAGRHFPSSENLEKFASAFNISLSELFDTGHFKSREELVNEILSALTGFENNKLQYTYKLIMNLKSIK